jgi:hypothetical protein
MIIKDAISCIYDIAKEINEKQYEFLEICSRRDFNLSIEVKSVEIARK